MARRRVGLFFAGLVVVSWILVASVASGSLPLTGGPGQDLPASAPVRESIGAAAELRAGLNPPQSGDGLPLDHSGASATYKVVFTESGLPAHTAWIVDFGGTVAVSTQASIGLNKSVGVYQYTVGPAVGSSYSYYPASNGNGTVNVTTAPLPPVLVTFRAATGGMPSGPLSITFNETGLPSGTAWSVTVNGATIFSTTASIIVPANLNTSYSFGVSTVGTAVPSPAYGTVYVLTSDVSEPVRFASPMVLGLAPAEGYAVISVGFTLLLLVLAVIILLFRQRARRRRERQGEGGSSPSGAPTPDSGSPPAPSSEPPIQATPPPPPSS